MEEKKLKKIHMLTLAFCIALMPPVWAVLAPYIGVSTGAVALVCAGLYVANGNQRKNAFKIAVGFLLGDLWAVCVVWITEKLSWNPDIELYVTLFVMGGLAVMIGETLSKYIFTPSWLCGWAIGLLIMGPMKVAELGTLPVQIAAAMLAGVDAFQKMLIQKLTK